MQEAVKSDEMGNMCFVLAGGLCSGKQIFRIYGFEGGFRV